MQQGSNDGGDNIASGAGAATRPFRLVMRRTAIVAGALLSPLMLAAPAIAQERLIQVAAEPPPPAVDPAAAPADPPPVAAPLSLPDATLPPDMRWERLQAMAMEAEDAGAAATLAQVAAALEQLAGAAFGGDNDYLTEALLASAKAAMLQGRHAASRDMLDRAARLAGDTPPATERARTNALRRATLAMDAALELGDDEAAHRHLATAYPLALTADPAGNTVLDLNILYARWAVRTNRIALAEEILAPRISWAEQTLGKGHRGNTGLILAMGELRRAQGRMTEAIDSLTRALADSNASDGVASPRSQQIAVALAQNYVDSGKPARAEPLLRDVVRRADAATGDVAFDALPARIALAALFADDGDFAEAEQMAKAAVAEAEARHDTGHPIYAGAIESLAQTYAMQNRFGAALPIMQRAVSIRLATAGPGSATTWSAQMALADMMAQMGRTREAESLLRCLIGESSAALGPTHPMALMQSADLAALLADNAQMDEARSIYERVVPALVTALGNDHPRTLQSQYGLGMLLYKQGEEAAGEQQLTLAWQASVAGLGAEHPSSLYYATALANMRLRMPDRAGDAIEPARMIADALRLRRQADLAEDFDGVSDGGLFRQSAPRLTLYADALWQARTGKDDASVAPALEALQNAMAGGADQAVLQTAARRVAESRDPDLGDLVRERESLEKVVQSTTAAYVTSLGEADDAESRQRRATLEQQRDSASSDLAGVDARIRARFPEYFSLIRPEAVDAAAIQATLADDEAILLIVPTEFGTHLVAITRTASSWQRADIRTAELADQVRRLLYDVGAPVEITIDEDAKWQEESGGGYPFSRHIAFDLHQQLVAPMADILGDRRHLFIVAAGPLANLPFGMLVTEAPVGKNGDAAALRSTSWFADAHALIQIPTIQSLVLQRRAAAASTGAPAPAANSFAGYGDPLLNGVPATRGGGRGATRGDVVDASDIMRDDLEADGTRLADPAALLRLARLPGTAIELTNMRDALTAPADAIRLREAATELSIRSSDLSATQILALATHGLMAGEANIGVEPGLVFTPPSKPSKADDGLLTSSEIAALNLNAEWVILSACNTAAGDGSEGAPGLSGLAQAFFFAGAQTLLASHWPVRDDVAARITVRTIEIQRDTPGLSRAEAFQRAMREIRADTSHDSPTDTWAHPNAWAPFTLIGDGAR